MHGYMRLITPTDYNGRIELHSVPSVKHIRDLIGGPLEKVPYWEECDHNGHWVPCVVYVNEEGIRDGAVLNGLATREWEFCLNRVGKTLRGPDGLVDWIKGNAVMLWGDAQFMKEL